MAFYNVNQLYECSTGLHAAPSMAFYVDIEDLLYSPCEVTYLMPHTFYH
jgi:hypothetical protein